LSKQLFCLFLCAASVGFAQPKIVVILTDNRGFGDLFCNNPKSKIKTPRLDPLATEGINFSDAHSPSGVCTPTRYSLLTGRYCWRSRLKKGVRQGTSPPLIERDRLPLPGMLMLSPHGYATGHFGKWHHDAAWQLIHPKEKVTPPTIDWSKPALYCPLDVGFTYSFGNAAPSWGFRENHSVSAATTGPFDFSKVPKHIIGGNNNKGWRQPAFTFEEMIPVWVDKTRAFIARWPARIKAGTSSEEIIYLIDIMATATAIAANPEKAPRLTALLTRLQETSWQR
jgi:arylsulfatase A-like enzyme